MHNTIGDVGLTKLAMEKKLFSGFYAVSKIRVLRLLQPRACS